MPTTDPLQRNTEAVVAFYGDDVDDCRPADAVRLYAGDSYTQHNPHVADGKEAFIAYFERMAEEYPGKRRHLQARPGRRQLRGPALPSAVADRRQQGLGRDRHLQAHRRRQDRRALGRLQAGPADVRRIPIRCSERVRGSLRLLVALSAVAAPSIAMAADLAETMGTRYMRYEGCMAKRFGQNFYERMRHRHRDQPLGRRRADHELARAAAAERHRRGRAMPQGERAREGAPPAEVERGLPGRGRELGDDLGRRLRHQLVHRTLAGHGQQLLALRVAQRPASSSVTRRRYTPRRSSLSSRSTATRMSSSGICLRCAYHERGQCLAGADARCRRGRAASGRGHFAAVARRLVDARRMLPHMNGVLHLPRPVADHFDRHGGLLWGRRGRPETQIGLSGALIVCDSFGVADGARTHDNRNHNPGLYQLSYSHRRAQDYSERPSRARTRDSAGGLSAARSPRLRAKPAPSR